MRLLTVSTERKKEPGDLANVLRTRQLQRRALESLTTSLLTRAALLLYSPSTVIVPIREYELFTCRPKRYLISTTLRNLRLVNSRFEELVIPIWCREVILTPDLVAQYGLDKAWSDHSMLQIQMTVHTSRMVIEKELDLAVELFAGRPKLYLISHVLWTMGNMIVLYFGKLQSQLVRRPLAQWEPT